MDFGDILKLWDIKDKVDAKPQKKAPKEIPIKAENARAQVKNSIAEAQAAWLERHGTPDNGVDTKETRPVRGLSRREIDDMPIDARLDLHGLTSREAESALAVFFTTAEGSGCRKVLVVHGRGLHSESEPVLANLVRRWLERRSSAGRSGYADAVNGGKGATWVLLKRRDDQRSR